MKGTLTTLTLLLVHASAYAWPDSPANQPTGTRCELPSGVEMILHYSPSATAHRKLDPSGTKMDFFVSRGVVGGNGVLIPFGIYQIRTVHDAEGWALIMEQVLDDGITPPKSPSPPVFRLPMVLTKSPSSSTSLVISFDTNGRVCTLRMKWRNTEALVGFAANYEDLSSSTAINSPVHQ